MKKLLLYQLRFIRRECPPWYAALILCVLAVLIYLNYHFQLERNIARETNGFARFSLFYLLFTGVYLGAFLLQRSFYRSPLAFTTRVRCILFGAPALFAGRICFDWHEPWIRRLFEPEQVMFYLRCFGWIVRVFVIMIPIYLWWKYVDLAREPFYGTAKSASLKPYYLMLLACAPLLLLAFSQASIAQYYPRVQTVNALSQPRTFQYVLFELSYAFDFLSIEFFFRGFLVIALATQLGPRAIIPMAAFYCIVHFGKPAGECISSFFGGVILGVIAYYTRSVWGGLIVHVGMAWMMEGMGLLLGR